jgi:hypothetical protein
MIKWFVTLLVVAVFASTSWGYREFKVPKKAFRKVTIEYFSNAEQKTSPDSTVTIFYDKDDIEMHREVVKGCGNVLGGIDSLLSAVLRDVWDCDTTGTTNVTWGSITPIAIGRSELADSTITPIPIDEDWGW